MAAPLLRRIGHRLASVPRRVVGSPSPVVWRLALTIGLVAWIAVVLLAGITLALVHANSSNQSSQRQAELGQAVAGALSLTYEHAGSWSKADVAPILAFTSDAGNAVRIVGRSGRLVAQAPPQTSQPESLGSPLSVPIYSRGRWVGTLTMQFGANRSTNLNRNINQTIAEAVAWTALGVALLTAGAAFLIAKRITRPVLRLTNTARAMGEGDLGVRVGRVDAPGELAELASTFDQMAEKVQREDSLRRNMVADVAHELRTPLAILQAETEALLDGVVEPDGRVFVSLHEEVLRLARVVTDLEVLAAADATGLRLDNQLLRLDEIAAGVVDAIAPRIDAAGLTLDRHFESVTVKGDRTRLHQVATNLLTNAVKFTPPGGRITMTVGAAGPEALLVVADTGPGIPDAELPKVFDRFWRGVGGRDIPGSGIGLAVVDELVRAHGGRAMVESTVGVGTRFTVVIPVAVGAPLDQVPA